jgi:hypothetical protein
MSDWNDVKFFVARFFSFFRNVEITDENPIDLSCCVDFGGDFARVIAVFLALDFAYLFFQANNGC